MEELEERNGKSNASRVKPAQGSAAWELAAQGVENKEVPGLMKSILRLRPATEREKEKITPLTQQNLMATWLVRTGLGKGNSGKYKTISHQRTKYSTSLFSHT